MSKGAARRKRANVFRGSMPTGVGGLDLILSGGYPAGRATVVRGASGTGKTVFALMFAARSPEPVVFVTFDESPPALQEHLRTFGKGEDTRFVDLRPDLSEVSTGGPLELGGMMTRIEYALEMAGATCLVLDAFDTLFAAYDDKVQARRELFRVFDWCRDRGITLLATSGEDAEYRDGTGMLDYACDCSVLLRQSLDGGLMTRTLHVRKCRGRGHWSNEYPFLIDAHGITLKPVTDTLLTAPAPRRKISTGVAGLDRMLGGKGVWQGGTVVFSGQSGTGKSLLALTTVRDACERGMKALHVSFEESPKQIVRDARSVSINLAPLIKSGNLTIVSRRSVEFGLEEHMIRLMEMVEDIRPNVVVLDPVSALEDVGDARTMKATILRLSHFLKNRGVTAIYTQLLSDASGGVSSMDVSSLIDTWVRLRNVEQHGEFIRLIHVQKSRGTAIDSQVKKFVINSKGLRIEDPYIGTDDTLSGATVNDRAKARRSRAGA